MEALLVIAVVVVIATLFASFHESSNNANELATGHFTDVWDNFIGVLGIVGVCIGIVLVLSIGAWLMADPQAPRVIGILLVIALVGSLLWALGIHAWRTRRTENDETGPSPARLVDPISQPVTAPTPATTSQWMGGCAVPCLLVVVIPLGVVLFLLLVKSVFNPGH
jgi:hypothetical protein